MSHFRVLVITETGSELETAEALQPFHEFECTKILDEYVLPVDVTDSIREDWGESCEIQSFTEYCKNVIAYPVLSLSIGFTEGHKYGWIEVDRDEEIIKIVRRTNPDSKWDFWKVGGRWCNYLLTKSGDRVDSTTKINIDFDRMEVLAQEESALKWNSFHRSFSSEIAVFSTWKQVQAEIYDISSARTVYWSQPLFSSLTNSDDRHEVDNYICSLEEYVESQTALSQRFFAVVKDGQWNGSGEMGWFASVSNRKDDWTEIQAKILEDVKPNQYLTVVDCHV